MHLSKVSMFLRINILIILVNTFVCGDVGDNCIASEDVSDGVCLLITDCEVAIRSIREKNYHHFNRCGFEGMLEIICCPHTSNKFGGSTTQHSPVTITSTTKTSQRIAEKECQKILANSIPPLGLHIIGGERASIGEFPHMVALGFERDRGYEFDCGGSLVSKNYVLTAAHCVDTLDRIEPSIARVGVVEIGGKSFDHETDFRIAEIKKHPEYSRKEKYHDLALLRLEKSVPFSSYPNAACLYTSEDDPTDSLLITGWGTTSTTRDSRSSVLLKANVSLVDRKRCAESYTNWRKLPRGVAQSQLCAGDPAGLKDTCQGDSGGPLQMLESNDGQYRIVGITSFGRGCGSPVPGVYTRVVKYLDWIESIVWP